MKRKLFLLLGLLPMGTASGVSFAQATQTTGTAIRVVRVGEHFAVVKTRAEAVTDAVVLKYKVVPKAGKIVPEAARIPFLLGCYQNRARVAKPGEIVRAG